MPWIVTLLVVVQVISAGAVIILVLLQHGKGADMGAAFGSGASGSLFGATGSANFLSRTTAVIATFFFLATIGLAYTSNSVRAQRAGSFMSQQPADSGAAVPAPAGAPAAPAPASAPAPADKPASIPK